MPSRILTGLLLILLAYPTLARELTLYTFHSPPYQFSIGSADAAGATVSTMRCALETTGWTGAITVVPQRRAIHSLRSRKIDGYFAVDQAPLLESSARRSQPVALEKWYFFSHDSAMPAKTDRIGVIAGSNEAFWLRHNGYTDILPASSSEQILALLKHKRVDSVLMDKRAMAFSYQEFPDWGKQLVRRLQAGFVRFAPLYAYFANDFLDQNPAFLQAFNEGLAHCATTDFSLDDQETALVRNLAKKLIASLESTVDLIEGVIPGNGTESMSRIQAEDSLWKAQAPGKGSEKARALLERPLSTRLRDWQDRQQGLVNEAFLMDRKGAVTALSRLTSDYWQGDEQKFSATVDLPPGEIHLTPLRFDSSTGSFQVIASAPVHLPGSGEFTGAVALGLDIERILNTPEASEKPNETEASMAPYGGDRGNGRSCGDLCDTGTSRVDGEAWPGPGNHDAASRLP